MSHAGQNKASRPGIPGQDRNDTRSIAPRRRSLLGRVVSFAILGLLAHFYLEFREKGKDDEIELQRLLQPLSRPSVAFCSDAKEKWWVKGTRLLWPDSQPPPSIHTLKQGQGDAASRECILISGNRISAAGSRTLIEPFCDHSDDCEVRQLPAGYTLMPSFADAHGHLLDLGKSLEIVDLTGATSLHEVITRIETFILERPHLQDDHSAWIEGNGWDQTRWNDTAGDHFPTWQDLAKSKLLEDRKISLKRIDWHALWLSEAAMREVEANGKVPQNGTDVPGGLVVRDPVTGKPTGVLMDNAMQLALDVMPPMTDADRLRFLSAATDLLFSLGMTSVGDAAAPIDDILFYQRLAARGELKLRVYAFLLCPPERQMRCAEEATDAAASVGLELPSLNTDLHSKLTVRTVKLFADGALGSWGSALKQPYSDRPSERGLLLLDPEELPEIVSYWHQRNWQVGVHAIGDRANSIVLDAFEKAHLRAPNLRPRVEHAQLVSPEDHRRFAKSGIIASMQPTHCTSDMGYVAVRIGQERSRTEAYPWRSILNGSNDDDSGEAHIAFGSDFPVERPDPLQGIWSAVNRLDYHTLSSPFGLHQPWYAEQTVTPLQALRAFTSGAAYAQHQERWVGSLEPAKKADFVVVRGDPLTDLTLRAERKRRQRGQRPPVKVVATAMDGQWAWTERQ
ncbi:unnamed protein product [Jaminaea pallidilutea]